MGTDIKKENILRLKAEIFDLIRSQEVLQFSINKLNRDKIKALKELENLEKPVAKPVEEGK